MRAGVGRVDDDRVGCCAVDEGVDAEVEIGLWAGDAGAEVGVSGADNYICWIFTIYRDDGRPIQSC